MCLENLISIPSCNIENSPCKAKYDITDVLGFSLEKGASINDTIEPKLAEFLKKQVSKAASIVRIDIQSELANQGYLANTALGIFDTEDVKNAQCVNATGKGIKLTRQKNYKCNGLRKIQLDTICVRVKSVDGATTGTTNVSIYDSAGYTHNIQVSYNNGNEICTRVCDGYNNPITIHGDYAIITFTDSNVVTYSNKPKCGCSHKNDCVDIRGYNGTTIDNNESYGMVLRGACVCDYDTLICNINSETASMLMLYKLGSLLAMQSESSQRLNYRVIAQKNEQGYLIDTNKKLYEEILKKTVSGWNAILKQYDGDGCISCNLTTTSWQI